MLDRVKATIRGKAPAKPPLHASGNNMYDREAIGWWDSARRLTMLEPLSASVFKDNVPGDFLEAGVFRGATSLFMAEMLRIAKLLGNDHAQRRMYVADSFEGMPPPGATEALLHLKKLDRSSIHTQGKGWWTGTFVDPELALESVANRMAQCFFNREVNNPLPMLRAQGIHFIKGYFNKSLPGPVTQLSLLRCDSDIFSSTYETLSKLYPLVSFGGYVVFDDWKIIQAQQAILLYRRENNISSPIFASRREFPPPMQTIDCMAFWRKDAVTG